MFPASPNPLTPEPLTKLRPLAYSEQAISAVKWLALALMVLDHWNHYLYDGKVRWMFDLGRVSMPLFAFSLGFNLARPGVLAMGGYLRTACRLLLFGLLATPAYFGLNHLAAGFWPMNMMFTLLVAVVTAWLLDVGGVVSLILAVSALILGGALGEYWWPGVGLVLSVWAFQRSPSHLAAVAFVACLALLWIVNGNFCAMAAIPVLLVLQRWWRVRLPRAQWFFYCFYPLHLTLLWGWMSLSGHRA